MAVDPGTRQIWQVVADPICICAGPWAINILDTKSGSTLATIPLDINAAALLFDAAGHYAYVSLGNGDVVKIAVASRKIVQTVSLGSGIFAPYAGGFLFSSDGTKLFLDASNVAEVLVLDPHSLKTLATVHSPSRLSRFLLPGTRSW